MSQRLTYGELIRLMKEKSPEELSADELEQIRERTAEFTQLSDQLFERSHVAPSSALAETLEPQAAGTEESGQDVGRAPSRSFGKWCAALTLFFLAGVCAGYLLRHRLADAIGLVHQPGIVANHDGLDGSGNGTSDSAADGNGEETELDDSSSAGTNTNSGADPSTSETALKANGGHAESGNAVTDRDDPKTQAVAGEVNQVTAPAGNGNVVQADAVGAAADGAKAGASGIQLAVAEDRNAIDANVKFAIGYDSTAVTDLSGPWGTALRPNRKLTPFTERAFDGPEIAERGGLPSSEFQRWLQPIPGHIYRINDLTMNGRQYTRFQGVAQFRIPWPKDAVFRLMPFQIQKLRLHFWDGRRGITFWYFRSPNPHRWAAFAAKRSRPEPQPESLVLLASDSGRYQRSGFGPIEFRHQDGSLVLSRGTIRLLTVPMAEPPREVILDGTANFRGISLFRSGPIPDVQSVASHNLLQSDRPNRLTWMTDLPEGAVFRKAGDAVGGADAARQTPVGAQPLGGQSVELSIAETQKPTEIAWAAVPIAERQLSEIVFRIADADRGTGFFLGDESGRRLHRVGFFRDSFSGQTTYGYLPPKQLRIASAHNPTIWPLPYAGGEQWFRIVAGFGSLKIWVSGDGRHWSWAGFNPLRTPQTRFATLGIYAFGGGERRSVKLSHLEVRELTAITNLAADNVRSRVPLPEFEPLAGLQYGTWLHTTIATRPQDVEMDEWRRACAIQVLQAGPPKQLATLLVDRLLSDAADMPLLARERMRLLDETAQVLDLWDAGSAQRFAQRYQDQAERSAAVGEASSVQQVVTKLLTAPIWTHATLPTLPFDLIRSQTMRHIELAEWQQARTLFQLVRFWSESGNPTSKWQSKVGAIYPFLTWAQAHVGRYLSIQITDETAVPSTSWRHPLLIKLSKEGYNVMAEFESALESQAYVDACQIISVSATTTEVLGLLPDPNDRRLLVSLPNSVALAMRDHRDLRTIMNRKFGPVGTLRVRQAIAHGNVKTVEFATIQFYGTAAAQQAHQWLGDRSLAAGQFGEAMDHYRLAIENSMGLSGSATSRSALLARMRLAAAMLGDEVGEPITFDVSIGDSRLTAAQFEALTTELKTTHAGSAVPTPAIPAGDPSVRNWQPRPDFVPLPATYTAPPKAKFEGSVGVNPASGASVQFDWVARQMAIATDNTTMYVSNRFQVVAYDLNSGAQKWVTALGAEEGTAHQLPDVAMKPVLTAAKIFVRRLTKQASELACLERATGKLIWRTDKQVSAVSDPIYDRGKLLALTSMVVQGALQVFVARFHPETGVLLSQEPFLRLTDLWGNRPPFQVVGVDGKLIAVVGGTVACSDMHGRPLWVRRQTWIPSSQDPNQVEQHVDPPFVADGRVYVVQRGVRTVECFEVETGRQVWVYPVAGIRRLVGFSGDRLIVETRDGFEAVDRRNRKLLWKHAAVGLLDGHLCGGRGSLLYVKRVGVQPNLQHPCLVWVDTKTGREVGHKFLPTLADKDPKLGPFISTKAHTWAFFGRGHQSGTRELMELIPTANTKADPPATDGLHWASVTGGPSPQIQMRDVIDYVMPGWTCTAPVQRAGSGLQTELLGQKKVLVTMAPQAFPPQPDTAPPRHPAESVRFVRRIEVPASGSPRLTLKVGHNLKTQWKLVVDVDGDQVLSTLVDDTTAPSGWRDIIVDLKPYFGQSIWVAIGQSSVETNAASSALWKQLRFIDK